MKSFIPWIGGKRALLHEILPRFPEYYYRYVEVFGGGASVLFAKKREDKFEVYNDIQSNLINLFKVVRDKPFEFLETLELFPLNSREEFEYLQNLLYGKVTYYQHLEKELNIANKYLKPVEYQAVKDLLTKRAKDTDVSRAVTFYKIIRLSYGSGGPSFGARPISLYEVQSVIHKASFRLKSTVIENKDYKALIKQYDRDDTFFYCDPPYFTTEDIYDAPFNQGDHQALKDILSNIKGKFLLSYNDCEYIRDLYKGYFIVEVSRPNNLKQRYEAGSEFKEVLIANYDISDHIVDVNYQLEMWNDLHPQHSKGGIKKDE